MTAVLLITALAGAGCAGRRTTDSAEPVHAKAEREFKLKLSSNPSTGYYWDYTADDSFIEFIRRDYKPDTHLPVAGSGGTDIFYFRALKSGTTTIIFSQYHPYDNKKEKPVLRVEFRIIIE